MHDNAAYYLFPDIVILLCVTGHLLTLLSYCAQMTGIRCLYSSLFAGYLHYLPLSLWNGDWQEQVRGAQSAVN